jgi:type II secretory pathway component PulM
MIRLTYRERWLAGGLGLFILAYGFYAFAVSPAMERVRTLKRVIPEKRQALADIKAKSAQYEALKSKLKDLRERIAVDGQRFEPLAFLESLITEKGLTEKVASMKLNTSQLDPGYSQTIVEMKLQDISLQQLIDLLLAVKSSNHALWINSLYAKKDAANSGSLEAVIQVSTLTAQNR